MLLLYRMLSFFISPLVAGWLFWRMARGKEDRDRWPERLGKAGLTRPQGRLIWLHAASVGEANSAMPLLQRLHDSHPGDFILLTTGTVTSSRLIGGRLPERAFHQFVPMDLPWAVSRFLAHWKPDLAIWVESELWPNLITQAARRAIPMALINARISERSHRRWNRYRSFFHQLTRAFSLIYAGSPQDQHRLQNLGLKEVRLEGNLKYDVAPLAINSRLHEELSQSIGERPVWMAASTHPGEEPLIATAHARLKQEFPDLLTVIAPRHPHRGAEIIEQLSDSHLSVHKRSAREPILPTTDIYIADTLGELGIFFQAIPVILIGGSLISHGGHNPIEPAQFSCAILCGPDMHNFQDIAQQFLDANALIQLTDSAALAQTVAQLLRNKPQQEILGQSALQTVKRHSGAVEKIAQALDAMLQARGQV